MAGDDEPEEQVALGGHDPWTRSARKLLGLMDTPAYLRRALRVRDAVQLVHARCQRQRDEWTAGVRLRLALWRRAIEGDANWISCLAPAEQAALRRLETELGPIEPPRPGVKAAAPAQAWADLVASVARFNERWHKYLAHVDLVAANRQIHGYNECYLLEKECAFRSARLARLGFQPMPLLSPESLAERYPLLPSLEASAR